MISYDEYGIKWIANLLTTDQYFPVFRIILINPARTRPLLIGKQYKRASKWKMTI